MKITLCGSMLFYKDMVEIMNELLKYGHEVKVPQLALEVPDKYGGGRKIYFGEYIEQNGGVDAFPHDHELWSLKNGAIRDHYEKIDWSDAIIVVNHEKRGIRGYIGGNTLIEMGVAFYQKKPIYVLNPISSDLSYKQEIMGMKTHLLNGNLDFFKSNF